MRERRRGERKEGRDSGQWPAWARVGWGEVGWDGADAGGATHHEPVAHEGKAVQEETGEAPCLGDGNEGGKCGGAQAPRSGEGRPVGRERRAGGALRCEDLLDRADRKEGVVLLPVAVPIAGGGAVGAPAPTAAAPAPGGTGAARTPAGVGCGDRHLPGSIRGAALGIKR